MLRRMRYDQVLVTGGHGFLGSAVVNELRDHGATVTTFHSTEYDLRDPQAVERLLSDTKPDAVIHLAAVVGGIGANSREPGRFFYENAKMGIELLEACRAFGVPKMVVSGTVCSYPKFCPLPFREEDLWSGYPEETNAPYGLAKKMLLAQGQAYRDQYGMNSVFLIPVNLYGPGDNFDLETGHVIPAMIRKFVEARESGSGSVTLWGDGSPTREFVHVRDAARAFRLALAGYDGRDPVNVGSGEEISIRRLAEVTADLAGYAGDVVWDTARPNGQPRRKLDTTRATERFGFTSEIAFVDGMRETIKWYESTLPGR